MVEAGDIDLGLSRERAVTVCLESKRFNLRFMSRVREREVGDRKSVV